MLATKKVAVLVESSTAYGRGILLGLTRYQREHRAWSISYQTPDKQQDLKAWISQWRGDGILARVPNESIAEELLALRCPLIDLAGGTQSLGFPEFGVDNREVAQTAYHYLSECGLDTFAFVGQDLGKYHYDDQRRDAFVEVVERHSHRCLEFQSPFRTGIDPSESLRRNLADWLRALPKPIGIFCCHDHVGHQVLEACHRAELRVPDEICVLGVGDDQYLCGLSLPHLSSIEINTERIGYEAAKLLQSMMQGDRSFDSPVTFAPAEVVVRESTDIFACENPQIAEAIRFVRKNACTGLTVDQIQEHVGISRATLFRGFKRVVGRSIKQEILRLQIEQAKIMLMHTTKPIYEIAEQTGFSESKYFATVFHKLAGTTPRQFRQSTKVSSP